MPTVFPCSLLGLKASQIGEVHLGFLTDLNVEDFDDYEAILKCKAAMQLLHNANPQLHVTVHVILDCDDRFVFMQRVFNAFAKLCGDTFAVADSNLKFVVYKFPVSDAARIQKIKAEMDDALGASHHPANTPVFTRSSEHYPWEYLHALIIAGPLHGVPMWKIKGMPSTSIVAMVGDKDSVNGQPQHLYEEMLEACKLKNNGRPESEDVAIASRLFLFPPRDVHGNPGFTRQCLVDFRYMEVFCVLFKETNQPAFKLMAEGLALSTSRIFSNRPNDKCKARCRINVSNMLSQGEMLEYLRAGSELNVTIFDQMTQKNVVHSTKCDEVHKIEATAIMLLEYMTKGYIVLVDSSVFLYSTKLPTLNLSALFQSYCSTVDMQQKDMPHTAHQEKKAILFCVLGTMAVFGNIFGPSPEICMAPAHRTAVVREIISGCRKCNPKGQLTKLTPNYDGSVLEAVFLHCIQIMSLHNYTSEVVDGHRVICNQEKSVIEAYEARDEQQLICILERFVLQSQHDFNAFKRSESMVDDKFIDDSINVPAAEVSIDAPVVGQVVGPVVCSEVCAMQHNDVPHNDVPVDAVK